MDTIASTNIITDIRNINTDFKTVTFSGYKKTNVIKEALVSLSLAKIEQSCYWIAELICSGCYEDIWDIIIKFYSQYIHTSNIKLSIYINKKLSEFKIIMSMYGDNMQEMRNFFSVRSLFCEIICILCTSNRGQQIIATKISSQDIQSNFTAPDTSYGMVIFKEGDPISIFAAVNELAYIITLQNGDYIHAWYWIECIIGYKVKIAEREEAPVGNAYKRDVVWIIWTIFMKQVNICDNKTIQCVVDNLLVLFSLNYNHSCHKKKKYILYMIAKILTSNKQMYKSFDDQIIFNQKDTIHNIVMKSNNIYSQIRKNEKLVTADVVLKIP